MLNVLIAIISQTFERCDLTKEESAYKERVGLISDVQSSAIIKWLNKSIPRDITRNLLFISKSTQAEVEYEQSTGD